MPERTITLTIRESDARALLTGPPMTHEGAVAYTLLISNVRRELNALDRESKAVT